MAHMLIVEARFYDHLNDMLIAGARAAIEAAGHSCEVLTVPGALEIPGAIALASESGQFDAYVALGVVIRGGTPHFDYVCQGVTQGLTDVSVRSRVPVGFGVLTTDDEAQALDRAGLPGSSEDKGAEAVEAAVATAVALRAL